MGEDKTGGYFSTKPQGSTGPLGGGTTPLGRVRLYRAQIGISPETTVSPSSGAHHSQLVFSSFPPVVTPDREPHFLRSTERFKRRRPDSHPMETFTRGADVWTLSRNKPSPGGALYYHRQENRRLSSWEPGTYNKDPRTRGISFLPELTGRPTHASRA